MKRKAFKKKVNIKRLRFHHKILFTLIGLTGVILLWRGIWTMFDNVPIINNPLISILFGLIFVLLSGIFLKLT